MCIRDRTKIDPGLSKPLRSSPTLTVAFQDPKLNNSPANMVTQQQASVHAPGPVRAGESGAARGRVCHSRWVGKVTLATVVRRQENSSR